MWIWIVKCDGTLVGATLLLLIVVINVINAAIEFFKDNY